MRASSATQTLPILAKNNNSIHVLSENNYKYQDDSLLKLELHRRHLLTQVILFVIITSVVYTLFCQAVDIKSLFPGASSIFGLFIIAGVSLGVCWLIKASNYPIKDFGLSLVGWKKALSEGILFTIPLILATIPLKWLFLQLTHTPYHTLLASDLALQLSTISVSFLIICYIIFCPLQELIVRGAMQSILYQTLTGSPQKCRWFAIILSNLMFAQVHIHISVDFAIVTFVVGIFWGWLYCRHSSLLGVSVSHILFGVWGQYILGTGFLIH